LVLRHFLYINVLCEGMSVLVNSSLVLTVAAGVCAADAIQVIKDARNRLAPQYGPKAVAFEFAQVGKDQRAQAFLGQLDKHPEVGGR
jgi:hypothetical protein